MYTDDEMLQLAGIQHYAFCPRQWALIQIEQQWDDNHLTVEGSLMHSNVDDAKRRQKNGNVITLRRVPIASHQLGLYGFTDAIELTPAANDADSITHPRYAGRWLPMPVEYKHGTQKPDIRDQVQVAAQAICLEEMWHINIPYGAIYYGREHARHLVPLDDELRTETQRLADEMHQLARSGTTPAAEPKAHCRNCSLIELCMPILTKKNNVKQYLQQNLLNA